MTQDLQAELRMIREMLSWLRNEERFREEILGASADADRAAHEPSRPAASRPSGEHPLRVPAEFPMRVVIGFPEMVEYAAGYVCARRIPLRGRIA
jgi:hypothetical protein